MSEPVAPGWYPDPHLRGNVRYFDGTRWTAHTAPSPQPVANQIARPPSLSRAPFVAGAVVFVIALAVIAVFVVAGPGSTSHRSAVRAVTATTFTAVTEPPAPAYEPAIDEDGSPRLLRTKLPTALAAPPGALPAELYAVPPGGDVVTPDSARATVDAFWTVRSDAVATGARKRLAMIETGSALAVDADRGCGCGITDHFGPITRLDVAVPHAAAFPAWFLADVGTTLNDHAWGATLVFTRASATEPWRVALAGGGQLLQADARFDFASAADGFAVAPSPDATARAQTLAPKLAEYYQASKEGRFAADAGLWEAGGLTDEWAAQLAQNRQGRVHTHNGLIGWYRYAVEPGTRTYVVALSGGASLACAAVRGQTTFVARPGDRVLQTADRGNWGPDLPPGSYRAVTTVDEYVPCFWFSPLYPRVAVNGATPPDAIATLAVP